MNNLAQTRDKVDSIVSSGTLLPAMLAANTLALFALERLNAIPEWIKTATAIFLSF